MTTDEGYEGLEGRVAGFISRAVAFSIDAVLIVIIIGALSWVVTQIERLFEFFVRDVDLAGPYVIAVPFIIVLYYTGQWALTGATIGKWLLGLRVVRADGYPPTFVRSLIRFVGYGLSAIVFFLGYLWVLFDNERRAWHDELAGTWVIYDFQRRPPGDVYSHRVET